MTFLKWKFSAPDGSHAVFILHGDNLNRTDKGTGTTGDTGSLSKNNFSFLTFAFKRKSIRSHNFLAGPHTKSAEMQPLVSAATSTPISWAKFGCWMG